MNLVNLAAMALPGAATSPLVQVYLLVTVSLPIVALGYGAWAALTRNPQKKVPKG